MWPFTRKLEVVVRHEIAGLDSAVRAFRLATVERRWEAKLSAGLIEGGRAPPPNKEEEAWSAWARGQTGLDESEALHLRWAYDVLRGVEIVPEQKRREAVLLYSRAQAAGYGLPDLDGRTFLPSNSGHAPGVDR